MVREKKYFASIWVSYFYRDGPRYHVLPLLVKQEPPIIYIFVISTANNTVFLFESRTLLLLSSYRVVGTTITIYKLVHKIHRNIYTLYQDTYLCNI